MTFKETKIRSFIKSISWRIVAFINSWVVLLVSLTESKFTNALIMNISGFFLFYFFERIWVNIKKGRYIDND
jgi:hypothetical protein